jgi:enoyl-CoA hydratase
MAKLSDYKTIRHSRQGRVLTLELNQPEKLNAIGREMHDELSSIFLAANDDPDSDVIVLTGAGRAFSAGGDIAWMQEAIDHPGAFDQIVREGKRIIFSLLECEKPVIAKLNGHATGLGATIALFCDVVFAADHAKIGDPHVAVGLTAGDGGAVIWPQLVGYGRAKHYLMTGDLIPAPQAADMGLILQAVPAADLDATVEAYAQRLAGGALLAIRTTKMSVNLGLRQLAHGILDLSLAYETQSNRSADHREAARAFAEKRAPVFHGD